MERKQGLIAAGEQRLMDQRPRGLLDDMALVEPQDFADETPVQLPPRIILREEGKPLKPPLGEIREQPPSGLQLLRVELPHVQNRKGVGQFVG